MDVALRPWRGPESDGEITGAAGSPAEPCAPSMLNRVRVAWEEDFEVLHSLAIVNRALCRGLLDRGHDVRPIANLAGPAVEPDERVELDARLAQALWAEAAGPAGKDAASRFEVQVHVRHQWPPVTQPPARGKWVLMQPWEHGSLPKAWLPMLRSVDEAWAYSRSVRDCYLEAEVPPDRVHIVPLGVAPDVFRPGLEPLPLAPGPEIRLLFVGGTIYRKGIDLLLTAFARAFRPADGVGLVIKEMGSRSFYRGQTAQAEVAALGERGYAVEYIDRTLSEA
jgi:glycosyltransferase involved in cell wall biosynthesis